ncbi:MAG TPA: SGNH/GDSL hydrolase family protein [Azospirillaceae bacterium]|nr:SGNH/GDSL hydrolase family protein [Azospirillaceae bacterium]
MDTNSPGQGHPGSGNASAPPFRSLVVFGDSLSDTGNAGRFCDGPVWVEVMAEQFGASVPPSHMGGPNYAVGGARLSDGVNALPQQAERYLSALHAAGPASRPAPGTLHIVYGGANDLLAAPWAPNQTTLVRDAIAALRSILDGLASVGAVDVLVPNLPNIGYAPLVRSLGPVAEGFARALTRDFNAHLAALLDEAGTRHRPMRLHRLDVHQLAETLMADPAAAGFRNTTVPCPSRSGCDGYLFWDNLHPTAAAHARLADAALRALPAGIR